jgi:hypothetical protein
VKDPAAELSASFIIQPELPNLKTCQSATDPTWGGGGGVGGVGGWGGVLTNSSYPSIRVQFVSFFSQGLFHRKLLF